MGTAAAYLLCRTLAPGTDGCGPPGHSSAGFILKIAPFAFPFMSALVFLTVGFGRRWRLSTRVSGAITIVVIGGMLEALILILEIAVHKCTQ